MWPFTLAQTAPPAAGPAFLWPWSASPAELAEVAQPAVALALRLLLFATAVPCAGTCFKVWRTKGAPEHVARLLAAGVIAHSAVWHLPQLLFFLDDKELEAARGTLGGFRLAFVSTFMMALVGELAFDRACTFSIPVLLSMIMDSFAASKLPQVLLCGLDATCWELPAQPELKSPTDIPGLAFKLLGQCLLVAASVKGMRELAAVRLAELGVNAPGAVAEKPKAE